MFFQTSPCLGLSPPRGLGFPLWLAFRGRAGPALVASAEPFDLSRLKPVIPKLGSTTS